MKRLSYIFTILGILLTLFMLATHTTPAQLLSNGAGNELLTPMERGVVIIKSSQGTHHGINVDIARSHKIQEIGLMHRTELPLSEGMLFIFDAPKEVTFWMKETLIPLDILFIDSQNVIFNIIKNTTPLSTTSLISGAPATKVLEINANLTEQWGIHIGDTITDSTQE